MVIFWRFSLLLATLCRCKSARRVRFAHPWSSLPSPRTVSLSLDSQKRCCHWRTRPQAEENSAVRCSSTAFLVSRRTTPFASAVMPIRTLNSSVSWAEAVAKLSSRRSETSTCITNPWVQASGWVYKRVIIYAQNAETFEPSHLLLTRTCNYYLFVGCEVRTHCLQEGDEWWHDAVLKGTFGLN